MIFKKIETLKNTPGTLDKRKLLRDNKYNKLFQKILTYTLDPRLTYGIKKIPQYNNLSYKIKEKNINEIFPELDKLIQRKITGNSASEHLKNLLETLNPENQQILKWIIAKDFKAGFGVSLINDEMKPFQVYEVPYMGAVSYSKKRIENIFKSGDAISEVKMDGRYINIKVEDSNVFMESRGGNPNPLMGALESDAIAVRDSFGFDVVLNGELVLKDVLSGDMDRYTSNGIISSFISIAQKDYDNIDITKEREKFYRSNNFTVEQMIDKLTVVLWDYIPLDKFKEKLWNKPRFERLKELEGILESTNSFKMIEYKVVKTPAQAMEHFQNMLARGEEGTILKSLKGSWKDGKPTHQVKMKLEIDVDLRIVSGNFGTPGTKNENVISSLNCESFCGDLKTSPGGIKEADMEFITKNIDSLIGKVVEVKCCGLSQDSNGMYSLLHPVFKKIRDDKKTGDTLDSIREIDSMAKNLSK